MSWQFNMLRRILFYGCLLYSMFCHAEFNNVNVSGYVDTSYNYLVQSNKFTSQQHNRLFDLQQNGFTLQQGFITAEWTPPQGLGAVGALLVGRDAYSMTPFGWDPYFGSQTLGIVPTKAYLQYAIQKFTLVGGWYDSTIGIESYQPIKDCNFSRSLLNAFGEPGLMLGLRGIYTFNEQTNLLVGVTSGWSTIRFSTHYPSLEYALNYAPTEKTFFTFQGISGQQRLVNAIAYGPVSRRDMFQLNASYQVLAPLTLQASYDYGIQRKALLPTAGNGQAVWQGIAGYVIYQFNDEWDGSVRGEIYSDRDGYTTGVRQNLHEVTLTLGYKPWKSILLRAETRHDISNVSSFVNANGNGTSNNQQSYALEGIYLF